MIIEGLDLHEFTDRTVYLYQTDMTVASTVNVCAEKLTLIDGGPKWVHTTKGLNAAGQTVYVKVAEVESKPSFVP